MTEKDPLHPETVPCGEAFGEGPRSVRGGRRQTTSPQDEGPRPLGTTRYGPQDSVTHLLVRGQVGVERKTRVRGRGSGS